MNLFSESERTKEARERLGMPSKDSPDWGTKAKPRTVFGFALASMLLYPLGAILVLVGEAADNWVRVGGLLTIAAALLSMFPVFTSRLYKISSEEKVKRDEFEQQLRYRSVTRAYFILAGIGASVLFYFTLAPDFDWWVPANQDHYDGLFWGFLIYALMLPSLLLSSELMKAGDDED